MLFKNIIKVWLERYVKKFFAQNPQVKLIVVVGSVGKTSTRQAIATVLGQKFKVRCCSENYNTELSAPVAMLGLDFPKNPRSLLAWLSLLLKAQKQLQNPQKIEVIVQELGVDRPGDMQTFCNYLHPNIAVVSAITPEHMEFFKTIQNIANEELAILKVSDLAIINHDDTPVKYLKKLRLPQISYGFKSADVTLKVDNFSLSAGYSTTIKTSQRLIKTNLKLLGEHSLKPVLAAVAVAVELGLSDQQIKAGLAKIKAVNGRMNLLAGVNRSFIIDDSYNSSPAAAHAALKTLYDLPADQKIAILGSMNELGDDTKLEHQKLGQLCDADQLDWLILIGQDASKYLAPVAIKNNCRVKSFSSARAAGEFVKPLIKPGALVLVKGSQGGIFSEEATKVLLANKNDYQNLVRQSPEWLAKK